MKNLSFEDRILGRTEPLPKTEFQKKALANETKYYISAEGNENIKVVGGDKLKILLSLEEREKLENGLTSIVANGLHIRRVDAEVTTVEKEEENKEEVLEEEIKEAPKPKRKRAK